MLYEIVKFKTFMLFNLQIHIVAKTGGLQCTILEGKINTPRDIACFNSCYAVIGKVYN